MEREFRYRFPYNVHWPGVRLSSTILLYCRLNTSWTAVRVATQYAPPLSSPGCWWWRFDCDVLIIAPVVTIVLASIKFKTVAVCDGLNRVVPEKAAKRALSLLLLLLLLSLLLQSLSCINCAIRPRLWSPCCHVTRKIDRLHRIYCTYSRKWNHND